MKYRWFALALLLGLGLALNSRPVSADSQTPSEPYSGSAICLPDAYQVTPDHCLALGPSQTLTDLAKKGITFPPRPLPASKPSKDLTVSPMQAAKINIDSNEPAKIYATLDDAAAGNNPVREIAPGNGLRYVSYIQTAEVNGQPYVQLKTGEWIRASPSGYPYFQGLVFQKTPANEFGWMIDRVKAHAQPSFNSPEVGEEMPQNTVIQIYDETVVDGMEWYQIGPDQWVPYQKSRRVRVDTTPPQGVTGDRWINVDLYDQVVTVYDNRQLVFATLVATGAKPYYTRPGLFKIYQKKELETMSGGFEANRADFYYLEDVPWTMYFDEARALHGAYWRDWFGIAGTHGCVNFSIGDAAWLFNWAKEGDWVYVWDPSGETPTDPSLYGAGGA